MLLGYLGTQEMIMMIIPLAFHAGLSYLVGKFAESKGRSFWAGFFLSFLLSPLIGVLIVALMGDNRGR